MKLKSRKGDNIVEYVLTFVLVGFIVGYAIFSINPTVFKNYFMSTFTNNQNSQNTTVSIGPLTE